MDPTETPRQYFDRLIAERMAANYEHVSLEPAQFTIGSFISATMSITDPEDAAAFYAGLVDNLNSQPDLNPRGAEYVARANIGWCFGEGMKPELIAMWSAVTGASHPVFGTTMPSTSKESFDAGVRLAGVQQ